MRLAHLSPMRPRDPGEPHRVASSLELFFDLVFVVAVSVASGQLHHALSEGRVLDGVLHYLLVFFGIWWAWMNFTWFATSFDTDDWLYRVTTIVQMGGVLILAAGIEAAFRDDFTVAVLGYVVMRVAMVSQWLRAARHSPEHRTTALTYAAGISAVQVLWLVMLALPSGVVLYAYVLLILAEIAVPVLAERRGEQTPWHPHHITERYSLFTLILLGESLLASSTAVFEALHGESDPRTMGWMAALVLATAACLWWIYFWPPHHRAITSLRSSLRYGYGHYVVFAAAGATSAGIGAELDRLLGHSDLSRPASAYAVNLPVAMFLVAVWWLVFRQYANPAVHWVLPAGAALILLDPLLPISATLTALVLAGVVAALVLHSAESDEVEGTDEVEPQVH